MTTEEVLLQILNEVQGTKQDIKDINNRLDNIENDITDMKKDIADMKEDIAEIKYEAQITRDGVNHNGEVLEQMVKDLAPLNMLNVKY